MQQTEQILKASLNNQACWPLLTVCVCQVMVCCAGSIAVVVTVLVVMELKTGFWARM